MAPVKRALLSSEIETAMLPPKTVAEATYLRLRGDLLDGRFGPGEPLRFDRLRLLYSVGISPLREALSRLATEQLVVGNVQRGFRGVEVSVEQMWDIIRARQLIEGHALAMAIKLGDDAWEAGIVAAFHRLSKAPVPGPGPHARSAWDDRHHAFHRALIAACGSPWLLHLADLLYAQSERYRRLRLTVHPRRILRRNVDREHRELMEAALARNPGRAQHLFAAHLARTGEQVATRLHEAPNDRIAASASRGDRRATARPASRLTPP